MGANWVGVRSVYLLLGLILGALRSCNGGTAKTSLFYSTMSFLIDKSRNIKIRRLWIDAAGCVEVVGCVTSEELGSWVDIPQGVG
ncbi:hypothetical protein L2E82_27122 [Cichorium intybus]|uniref:Uncharacterized protein n=1 Tax=Cichorium intybus TaxID=13427 RepID=A0ACB9CSR5_CICIN|nr:hypothetical protein L2E82_27122 [Cichorium intybus]